MQTLEMLKAAIKWMNLYDFSIMECKMLDILIKTSHNHKCFVYSGYSWFMLSGLIHII